jgi:hypothetical protein
MSNPSRLAAIAAAIAEQVRALTLEHAERAETNAADADGDGEKPVVVKLRFAVEWPAGSQSPRIRTGITYGSPVKDETETTVDQDQGKLPLEFEPAPKAAPALLASMPDVTNEERFDSWRDQLDEADAATPGDVSSAVETIISEATDPLHVIEFARWLIAENCNPLFIASFKANEQFRAMCNEVKAALPAAKKARKAS